MRLVRFLGVALTTATLCLAPRADAQCASGTSFCVACHETQGAHAVLGDSRSWHRDHGFADLCAACHGGDPAAVRKQEAHAGLRAPLDDAQSSCGGCHADAAERAAHYRAKLAAAGASSLPPAPPPTLPPPAPPSGGPPSSGNPSTNAFLVGVGSALGLVLVALFARDPARSRVRIAAWLRAERWSAYVAGAGLGVLVAVSEAAYGRPIAASGAFDRLAAYVGSALFPKSPYYAYVMKPGITWQVWLVLGVLLGSFVSARLAGTARMRWLPDSVWAERFGTRRSTRLLVAFFGAVLMQVGAGIAGGCTSGLAISGGASLSPAAFVFMAGMFAAGIPTAWLWYRSVRTSARRRQP